MNNPFAQPAKSQFPASNPFSAPTPGGGFDATRTIQKPSNSIDHDTKRKGRGFNAKPKDTDTSLSNGNRKKKSLNKSHLQDDAPPGPRKHKSNNTRHGSPFGATPNATETSRPSSPASDDSDTNFDPPEQSIASLANSTDPHARKVYIQLRNDGLTPPNWPSQPGNPRNKAAMAKFRQKYENYRAKVRASLTKAGLIDDPNKRRTLQDAIEFKGICEDMCPEFEKITRITESDINYPEKDPKTNFAATVRMVKKLARSAAGQEAPLPMDVRSVPALKRTLDYLVDDLLRDDGNLPVLHGFLWDRTRAIRRDFAFFSSLTPKELKTQIYVLENITRFHVTSLHLLSQKDKRPEDFVEQQESEQLGKSLLSLRDLYDDCSSQGIICENEAEFRAYYLIFHAQDPNIIEVVQRQWKPQLWKDSNDVRTAVSLVEAMQNTRDFHGPLTPGPTLAAAGPLSSYFQIVEDPTVSYTMACFAETHFAKLRRSILIAVCRALARPKGETKDITANDLNKYFHFDTVDEAIEFAALHDLEFENDPDYPSDINRQRLMLRANQQLSRPKLQHQFSQKLVEQKRGSRSLPTLIHESVSAYQPNDLNAKTLHAKRHLASEGSLFVSDTTKPKSPEPDSPKSTSFGLNVTDKAFPTSFGQPSGGVTDPLTNGVPAVTTTQSSTSLVGLTSQTPFLTTSSFTTTSQPADNQTVNNPFGHHSQFSAPSVFGAQSSSTSAVFSDPSQYSSALSVFGAPAKPSSAPSAFDSITQTKKTEDTSEVIRRPETLKPKPNPFGTFSQPQTARKDVAQGLPAIHNAALSDKPKTITASTTDEGKKAPIFGFSPFCASAQFSAPPTLGSTAATSAPPMTASNPFGLLSTTTASNCQIPSVLSASQRTETAKKPKELFQSIISQPPANDQAPTPAFNFGNKAAVSGPAAPVAATPIPSVVPGAPPRDTMGDFTKWFVLGDKGLLDEFKTYMADELLRDLYNDFEQMKQVTWTRQEEEARNAEAKALRVYNIRLKFFYLWKTNAREKRQRFIRRSGRDQQRDFYAARRKAEQEAKKEAARKAAEEQFRLSTIDRGAELKERLQRRKTSRHQAEEELLASGVLSGVRDERKAAARIVFSGFGSSVSSVIDGTGSVAGSLDSIFDNPTKRPPSKPVRKDGAKTRALRESLLSQSEFRRSLPSTSSRKSASPSAPRSVNRVSERWRLKAMGFTQMPDGSILPDNIAEDILYRGKRYPGLWSGDNRPSSSGISSLRSSLHDSTESSRARAASYGASSLARLTSTPGTPEPSIGVRIGSRDPEPEETSPKNKRKRPNLDGEDDGQSKPHKRSISDLLAMAKKVRQQHKEIRATMDEMLSEDTAYYRDESERITSETRSRGATPWEDGI